MVERLADVRVSVLVDDEVAQRLLVAITGLSPRQVSSRIRKAHGNMRAASLFVDEWPDGASLAAVTVAAARDAGLEDEVVAATGLTTRAVRGTLNKEHGKRLLANVFPELDQDSDDDAFDEDEDEDSGASEEPDEGDEEQSDWRGGQRRFLDPATEFTATVLIGAIPVAVLRTARPLLNWLAARAGLSTRSLGAKCRAANGRTLVSTLLADVWPIRVAGPSRAMLGELGAATVLRAPSVLRWVADAADLAPEAVRRRLEAASPTQKVAGLMPSQFAADGADLPDEPRARARPPRASPANGRKVPDSEPPPSSARARTVASRYALGRMLGEGGFGVAWEATRLEHPQKRVVLKTSADPERGRLREEMGIAFELRHQNICTYLDFGTDRKFGTYLVMDHGGTSLERVIEGNDGKLDWAVAFHIVRQAAAGLDYAHSKGVIHQDVKPGNVLIDKKSKPWEVRLGDFGIAVQGRAGKNTVGDYTVIATAPVAYTRAYAAPEQLRGEKARKATDQYGLALVLCSMLEGHVFKRKYDRRNFHRLNARQNAAIERALRDDPGDRFASCAAFVAALGKE